MELGLGPGPIHLPQGRRGDFHLSAQVAPPDVIPRPHLNLERLLQKQPLDRRTSAVEFEVGPLLALLAIPQLVLDVRRG